MALRFSIVALASLVTLGGCAVATLAPVPVSTLPMANVVVLNDGSVYELAGELVVKMNRTGQFSLASKDGDVVCNGATNDKGKGASVCNGGLTIGINIPEDKFGKFNGSYIDNQPEYRVAVGWGEEADMDTLKSMLGL